MREAVKRQVAIVTGEAGLRSKPALAQLHESGFAAVAMGSAADLYRAWVGQLFDVVVVDVALPDEHGLTVVRHLRSLSRTGIVRGLLEGVSDDDRARGLDALRAMLAAHATADGVGFNSAAWLYTARRA